MRRSRRIRPRPSTSVPPHRRPRRAVDERRAWARHIAEHPAGIVRGAARPRVRQRTRKGFRQAGTIGQLNQQHHPGMRHQTLAVRRHFYCSQTSRWLHQLGVLLGRDCRRQEPAFSRPGRTFPPPRSARYRRFQARRTAMGRRTRPRQCVLLDGGHRNRCGAHRRRQTWTGSSPRGFGHLRIPHDTRRTRSAGARDSTTSRSTRSTGGRRATKSGSRPPASARSCGSPGST